MQTQYQQNHYNILQMSFEYDLSSIVCPYCQNSNNKLEVIKLHIFTADKSDKLPFYDVKCLSCLEVFPINTATCLRKMTQI